MNKLKYLDDDEKNMQSLEKGEWVSDCVMIVCGR